MHRFYIVQFIKYFAYVYFLIVPILILLKILDLVMKPLFILLQILYSLARVYHQYFTKD